MWNVFTPKSHLLFQSKPKPDPAASHIPPVLQEARPKSWCWPISPSLKSPTTPLLSRGKINSCWHGGCACSVQKYQDTQIPRDPQTSRWGNSLIPIMLPACITSETIWAVFQRAKVKSSQDPKWIRLCSCSFPSLVSHPSSEFPVFASPSHGHRHRKRLAGLSPWFSHYEVDELHPINFLYLILGFINLVFY